MIKGKKSNSIKKKKVMSVSLSPNLAKTFERIKDSYGVENDAEVVRLLIKEKSKREMNIIEKTPKYSDYKSDMRDFYNKFKKDIDSLGEDGN